MLASTKIRCVVVVAPVEVEPIIDTRTESGRMLHHHQPRFRPSDLLPWADPHIRSLVEQLQHEVRSEAAQREANRLDDYWGDAGDDPFLNGSFNLDGSFDS